MNKSLAVLKQNNSNINIEPVDGNFKVEKLWNDDSLYFIFKDNVDLGLLENIIFPEELVAVYHKDKYLLEYIFSPLNPASNSLSRRFEFRFKDQAFTCYFDKSTKVIELLSSCFRMSKEKDSSSNYRNLRIFQDFFKKETLSKSIQEYFKGKNAFSFFIKGNENFLLNDLAGLSKHLNFYMTFYDRNAPFCIVLNKKEEQEKYKEPCYSLAETFPLTINAREINPIILDILSVAHETKNIRLKYLFYFQVLEYCSYYYLNEDLKVKLCSVLKSPDIASKPEYYSKNIIDEFKNFFRQNDDTVKLEKAILNYCNFDDIKLELKENCNYFCRNIEFDGGFVLNAIIKDEQSVDNPANDKIILKNIKENIESIRNVLVHLRESRENKVILPTRKNDNLLRPYLFLLRRIAERVAIQFD